MDLRIVDKELEDKNERHYSGKRQNLKFSRIEASVGGNQEPWKRMGTEKIPPGWACIQAAERRRKEATISADYLRFVFMSGERRDWECVVVEKMEVEKEIPKRKQEDRGSRVGFFETGKRKS